MDEYKDQPLPPPSTSFLIPICITLLTCVVAFLALEGMKMTSIVEELQHRMDNLNVIELLRQSSL